MKIIICGGRSYNKRYTMFDYLDALHRTWPGITHVVTGGATGADALGSDWATVRGIPQTVLRADWVTHGRNAGLIRNVAMADTNPNCVVAFPGGKGTEHMVRVAMKRGINIFMPCPRDEYSFDPSAFL